MALFNATHDRCIAFPQSTRESGSVDLRVRDAKGARRKSFLWARTASEERLGCADFDLESALCASHCSEDELSAALEIRKRGSSRPIDREISPMAGLPDGKGR